MKLHISIGTTQLAGYTNVDVTTTNVDMGDLSPLCGEAECTDIILDDILRFMPHQQIPVVLKHINSRLRHNGTVTIIFPDINAIVRTYQQAKIDEEKLNQVLFGLGTKSCFSYQYILNIFKELKIDIQSVTILPEQTTIIAKRP